MIKTEVEVYANTKYDRHIRFRNCLYFCREKLADDWQGNGSDYAYVDNFDVFRIQDENYLRGADVSFLPAVEDLDGKYFAKTVYSRTPQNLIESWCKFHYKYVICTMQEKVHIIQIHWLPYI